jgi:cell division GTPase FtsZ
MAVSRRTVLRTSLAALSLGVSATRGWAAANRTDVIVIGAGFAGLNAAAQLRDQGLRVLRAVPAAARTPPITSIRASSLAHHRSARCMHGCVTSPRGSA